MDFKIKRQDLSINSIDFSCQSFEAITRFIIFPIEQNFKSININCNGPIINRIIIKSLKLNGNRDSCHYENIADNIISVLIPKNFQESNKNDGFILIIYFKSQGNKCGLQFVISSVGYRGDYMYCAPYNNCSGLSFPCIDTNQAYEWMIEINVPNKEMIVICSGNLISKDDDNYIFHIKHPTTASRITFAVGQFDYLVDSKNPVLEYYFPPRVIEYIKTSAKSMEKALSFLQSKIQLSYPFNIHKSVFVDYLIDEHHTGSSITLFDVNLLHNNMDIDQIFYTSKILTVGLCEQFFGVFIEPKHWKDSWICWGFAEYMGWEFLRETYPDERHEESIYEVKEKIDSLIEYEKRNSGIVLDASFMKEEEEKLRFDRFDCRKMSVRYKRFYRIKSGLVVRSWALSVSNRALFELVKCYMKKEKFVDYEILNKIALGRWRNLIESLVRKPGHIDIMAKAHFLSKQKIVELVINQSIDNDSGSFIYSGAMEIVVQEPDGLFTRVVRMRPEILNNLEVVMCSKLSHLKTGQKLITRKREEIIGPLLGWVELDPNLRFVGNVKNLLDKSQAKLIVEHETNFWAKFCGLICLENEIDVEHLGWLKNQITDRRASTRIRLESIRQLRKALLNSENSDFPRDSLKESLVMLFCEKDDVNPVLKMNSLKYFGDYLVYLALVEAASVTYVPESLEKWAELFLLFINMLEFCNQFTALSVPRLQASIITAITNSICLVPRSFIRDENLGIFINILNNHLIDDFAIPSRRFCVTSAILNAFAKLDQSGFGINLPPSTYLSYDYDDNEHLRLAGISVLLSFIDFVDHASKPLEEILNFLLKTEVPVAIRCKSVDLISEKLINLKFTQNIYLLQKLSIVFRGHIETLTLLASESPFCLQASIRELLDILRNLSVPIPVAETRFFEERLNNPILSEATNEKYISQYVSGPGDVNLSDDSD